MMDARWGQVLPYFEPFTCCLLENLSQTLLWSFSHPSPGDWRWRTDRKEEEHKQNKCTEKNPAVCQREYIKNNKKAEKPEKDQ